MPKLRSLWFACCFTACLQAADSNGPLAAAQQVFDAMSAHDAVAARAVFLPEATLISVGGSGKAVVTPVEKWLDRVGTSKDAWLERIWEPKVLESGPIAVVWAPYDFHLNGKLHHCGIDSLSMVQLDGKWRISSVSYTTQTSGCPESPLGPPTKPAP